MSIAERIELQKFVHKVVRWGVAEIEVTLEDIIDRMKLRYLKLPKATVTHYFISSPTSALPPILCPCVRGHYFDLPVLKYEVTKKSFINRMLYKYKNIVTA